MGVFEFDPFTSYRLKAGQSGANRLPDPKAADWHAQRNDGEPRCAADQWRTRDRSEILYISEMTDSHLGHCIRFASTKRQHRSRLNELLRERGERATRTQASAE